MHTHDVDIEEFDSGGAKAGDQLDIRMNTNVTDHAHPIDAPNKTSGAASATTTSSGGSATQDFMNPFQTFSYIIKI